MPDSRDAKSVIDDILEKLVANYAPEKGVLFGSYARGDADEYSNIDLITISESKRPFVERFKDFSELWKVSPIKDIDVLVYTPQEFQEMYARENPFIVRAMEEGKVIYEA